MAAAADQCGDQRTRFGRLVVTGLGADFAYGNARLRARRGKLLHLADYERLLDCDLPGLITALAATPYRDLIDAMADHSGQAASRAAGALAALRLEQMRGFYTGQPGELVDLLLARYDLHNLVVVLRGCACGSKIDEVLAALVPVGRLTGPVVSELAAQPDLPAAVELLVRHRLARPAAAELRAAVRDFELHADQAALEADVARAHARRVTAALDRFGRTAGALRDIVAREADETNLLAALRHRVALMAGELPGGTPAPAPLEGGRLGAAALATLAEAVDPGGAAAALARIQPAWRAPLQRWLEHGDLARLATDLETRRALNTVRLFATGDPLGIAIPAAYTAAVELEARNLRLIAAAAAGRVEPASVRQRLLAA